MIAIFCTTWSGLSKSFSVWIIPLVDIAYMTTALWNWNFSVTITIALLQHSSQYHCTGLPCTHCEWVEMYISTIYRLSCICTEAHKRYITSCTAQWVNWSWYARPGAQNASVAATQLCSQAPYQYQGLINCGVGQLRNFFFSSARSASTTFSWQKVQYFNVLR